MKYLFALVITAAIVMLIVNSVSEGVMPDGAAVVSRIEGTAVIMTSDAPAGRSIGINDQIAKNGRVEVQGNSMLELRLPDGGWLRLSENARLTVRMLQFEKRTGSMSLQAILHDGMLWAKTNKSATAGSGVEVLTSAGLVAGKAAVFGVDAVENGGAEISVYEGSVLAMGAADKTPYAGDHPPALAETPGVSVQAMQYVTVSAREGVSQPQDIDMKAAINDWVRWNLQRDAREGLASITIAPAFSTVTRGGSLQLAAIAHYPDNVERDITSFATWSSSDGSIANIDPFGAAAGNEIGAATIAAAIEDMNGSTVLNVIRLIVSIKVIPASGSMMNGAVQQFRAIGTFSDKTVKDITTSAVWSSSNRDIAFVDADGRAVAGNGSGIAVISASLGTKQGSAKLKVRRELVSLRILPENAMIMPGHTQMFGAIGSYSDKTTQDLTEKVEWESSDIRIAVMDQAHPGRILGQKAGSAAIKATFRNKSGLGTITVE